MDVVGVCQWCARNGSSFGKGSKTVVMEVQTILPRSNVGKTVEKWDSTGKGHGTRRSLALFLFVLKNDRY